MDWNSIESSIKELIDDLSFDNLLLTFVANVSFKDEEYKIDYYRNVISCMTKKQINSFSVIQQKKLLSEDFIKFYHYHISDILDKNIPNDEVYLLGIFYNIQNNKDILDFITKRLLNYNKSIYFDFKKLSFHLLHNQIKGYEVYENAIHKLEESVSRVVNTDKMFNRKTILDMLFVVSTFPETNGYYIDLKQFNMLHLVENPTVSGIFDYSKLAIN
jgi:hypothetical protein